MNKIPEKVLADLVLHMEGLKKVSRSGWKKKGIKNPESVADHTMGVAFLSMIMAPQLKLDEKKLIKMALIHDLAETITGDIIWEKGNIKTGSEKNKLKDEDKAVRKMFSGSTFFKEYLRLWEEYRAQETKEARVIKVLDKLEMVIQALIYEKDGIRKEKLQEFWDNAEIYIKGSGFNSYYLEFSRRRNL